MARSKKDKFKLSLDELIILAQIHGEEMELNVPMYKFSLKVATFGDSETNKDDYTLKVGSIGLDLVLN